MFRKILPLVFVSIIVLSSCAPRHVEEVARHDVRR